MEPGKGYVQPFEARSWFIGCGAGLLRRLALSISDISSEGGERFLLVGRDALRRGLTVSYRYRGDSIRNVSERKDCEKNYDFSKSTRGPIIESKGKTRITIYLDDDVIDSYRDKADKMGRGYQTPINEALRDTLGKDKPAVDAKTLRRSGEYRRR